MSKRIGTLLLTLFLILSATSCMANDKQSQPNNTDNGSVSEPKDPTLSDRNDSISKEDGSEPSPDNNDTTDKDKTYDPNGWVNPGALTSPYAIANAAAKASPSVVAITTEVVTYGGFYGNYVSEGAGSGVIYSEDGYIITNNHVIEGADTVRVTLVNGDTYDAKVIGADPITDTAVLKIDASGLSAAIPSNEALLVGQPVIAIGNPMGTLSGTVTSGIVSALSRWISVEGIAMELLQFDAAVSPGNSGGGLFDLDGNLIAIVNAKSSGDGVEGISFAIPVARALDITRQFIEKGYVSGRPDLGIEITGITATNYESFRDTELWEYAVAGNRIYPGLYVTNANGAEYAADGATLAFGDRVVKIGDSEISDESDLAAALSRYEIGDAVTVTVARLSSSGSYFGSSYKSYEVQLKLVEYTPSQGGGDGNNGAVEI